MKTAPKGFTLIELMIVIAIIGILALAAVPTYQNYIGRTQMSEAINLAAGLKDAIVEAYSQDGVCPDNTTNGNADDKDTSAGIDSSITGRYVASVKTGGTDDKCTIVVTMRSSENASEGIASGIANKTLTLTMNPDTTDKDTGSIKWGCTSTVEQKYLPKSCKYDKADAANVTTP